MKTYQKFISIFVIAVIFLVGGYGFYLRYDGWQTNGNFLVSGSISSVNYPLKRYVATVTQSGTNAPVSTVLVNTLGFTGTWTRNSTGEYALVFSGWSPINTNVTTTFILGYDADCTEVKASFDATAGDGILIKTSSASVADDIDNSSDFVCSLIITEYP